MCGRDPFDLGPDRIEGLETEIDSKTIRQLGRDDPVGAGHPWRHDLGRQPRDSSFKVRRGASALRVPAAGSTTFREHRRGIERGLHRHEEVNTLERSIGQVAIGEVRQRVRTEQHERAELA